MSELQQSGVPTQPSEDTNPKNFSDFEPELPKVRQTILKLTEPLVEDRLPPTSEMPIVSEPVLKAMQELISAIAEMQSSEGGSPCDVPPTPENFTPAILEKAYKVLDALKTTGRIESTAVSTNSLPLAQTSDASLILVDDLIPKLLWYLLRSSYDVMRLIGGVPGRIFPPDREVSTGIVRLVAGLEARSPNTCWFFDFATDRASSSKEAIASSCATDSQIQSDEIPVCQQQLSVEQLVAQLTEQIQAATPQLALFTPPTPVELLEPGSAWQSAQIQLTLDLEFVADPEPDTRDRALPEDASDPYLRPPSLVIPIRLTRGALSQASSEITIRQELLPVLSEMHTLDLVCAQGESSPSASDRDFSRFIPQIVYAACNILEAQQPSESDDPPCSDGETTIDLLVHRLLWQMVRSSYDVMQMVAGVTAKVLQPERNWETGMLRLVGIFQLETPVLCWKIDLATGESGSAIAHLPPSAIIQSSGSDLCGQPITVENLLRRISEQFRTVASIAQIEGMEQSGIPQLDAQLWLSDEIPVDLREGQKDQKEWTSGLARLSSILEFIPTASDRA